MLQLPCDPRSPLFLARVWKEVISTWFVQVVNKLCAENKGTSLKGRRRGHKQERLRGMGSQLECSWVLGSGTTSSYSMGEPLETLCMLTAGFPLH